MRQTQPHRTALEMLHDTDRQASDHGVHRQQVHGKGEEQQELEPAPGDSDGIGTGNQCVAHFVPPASVSR